MDSTKLCSKPLCRCCLLRPPDKNLKVPYTCDGRTEVYTEMLKNCFDIHLAVGNQAGDCGICKICIGKLRDACDFKRQVEHCHMQFEMHLREAPDEDDEKSNMKVVFEEHDETRDTDCMDTQSTDDDDDEDDDDDDDDKKLSDMAIAQSTKKSGKTEQEQKTNEKHEIKPSVSECKQETQSADDDDDEDDDDWKLSDTAVEQSTKKSGKTSGKQSKHKSLAEERLAHVNNINTMIQHSNIAVFKGKNKLGFRCFYCQEYLDDLIKLREHQTASHDKTQAMKILYNYSIYHLVVYAEITDLKCTLCEEKIPTLKQLKSHLVNVHGKNICSEYGDRLIPYKASENGVYMCQVCSGTYETFISMQRHMNVHYNNYVCDECGSGHVTQERLKIHRTSHKQGSFACEHCAKVFTSMLKVKDHVKFAHENGKRLKCAYCSERFNGYYIRQAHMVAVHSAPELKFTCKVCGQVHKQKYALTRHIKRMHLRQKDNKCDKCSFTCVTIGELKNHMLKHSGVKSFECSTCGKTFARKYTLTEHMKTHTDEKKHVCDICGHAFVQKCALKGHKNTQHSNLYENVPYILVKSEVQS